jgi:hypothetical protein
MNAHILVTCRKPELEPMSFLVFKTLRIGFPTATIHVYGNGLSPSDIERLEEAVDGVGVIPHDGDLTIHHRWIEGIVRDEQEPFWLVDTDMVFYEKIEDWKFDTALAGYRIPEFFDEFANAITRSRLHTSLLFIDPVKVREQVKAYEAQFPVTPFNPLENLIYPVCQPLNGRGYFHDTASLLYHAIGGTAFTDAQKNSYAHLHFGTISDIVLPRLNNGAQMQVAREAILKNPELGRGLWRWHEDYWAARQPTFDGKNVIAPITQEDSQLARAWNAELCCGNTEAMAFCDLFFGLIHGLDDCVDQMEDGRPTLSKAQIVSIFFCACVMYNTTFYRQNAEMLFPLILDVTNNYSISVEWERSPLAHRRQMADLMRMSGNRLYHMVALLCGGEHHALNMMKKLMDKDWVFQHDAAGNPI